MDAARNPDGGPPGKTLSPEECETLLGLFEGIRKDLSCTASGDGFPCRTDRFDALACMARVLHVHGSITRYQLEKILKQFDAELEA